MTFKADPARNRADEISRIRCRFPNLEESALSDLGRDLHRLEAHLAAAHHMTLIEAHEELADFLYVEKLSRELTGD